MIIRKYKLKSKHNNEFEFEVTRHRVSTSTTKIIETVDENGNKLSAREKSKTEVETSLKEGLSAISLPSREPAIVEILEEYDPQTGQEISREEPSSEGRPSSLNLTQMLNSMEPTSLPKKGEEEGIIWSE